MTEANRPAPAARPASRKPTIRDVATAAGVSTATVSYVLNETPGQTIREATRARVREAAASLGYVPHAVARTLREGNSRIVILNVGSMLGAHSLDSFINGMSAELRAQGHSLLVVTGTEPGMPAPDAIAAIAPRAVLDLVALLSDAPAAREVYGVADGYLAGLAFHTRTQVQYLAERGHRELAFAVPIDPGALLVEARLEHVRQAAADLGLPPVRVVRLDLGDDRDQRARAIRSLVETPVTAVAAYDDDVGFAVLAAMSREGLAAPDDLAVIGFDAGERGRFWEPALTTVRIDAEAFGRRAARVVLGAVPGDWEQAPSHVVVRESA